MLVKIYTYSNIKSIRPKEGVGLYILCAEIGGREATLQGEVRFRENPQGKAQYQKATANVSELIVNLSAIERFTNKCDSLEIYTDSSWFAAGWDAGWLDKWKNNGWKNNKGEPVAHMEEWQAIDKKLTELNIRPVFHLMEHHPYKKWFEHEMELIEEKEDE